MVNPAGTDGADAARAAPAEIRRPISAAPTAAARWHRSGSGKLDLDDTPAWGMRLLQSRGLPVQADPEQKGSTDWLERDPKERREGLCDQVVNDGAA
jgi:hypothetical protein